MKDSDIEDYIQNPKATSEEIRHLPEAIASYLYDLNFPANKSDIMRTAQRNDAPNEILHKLSLLNDNVYQNVEAVAKAVDDIVLNINPEIVQGIIQKAREFQAKEDAVIPEDEINTVDHDWALLMLADHHDDLTYNETKVAIDDLEREQQETLVALMWLGRGDYMPDEWDNALDDAHNRWNERTSDYLLTTPMLSDYLAEGLSLVASNAETR
jgi:hypothetical protein